MPWKAPAPCSMPAPKPVWIIEIIPESEHCLGDSAFRAFKIMFDAGYSAYMFDERSEKLAAIRDSPSGDRFLEKGSFLVTGGNVIFSSEDIRK